MSVEPAVWRSSPTPKNVSEWSRRARLILINASDTRARNSLFFGTALLDRTIPRNIRLGSKPAVPGPLDLLPLPGVELAKTVRKLTLGLELRLGESGRRLQSEGGRSLTAPKVGGCVAYSVSYLLGGPYRELEKL